MTFIKCITDKATKGVLKKADVDSLQREYEGLVKRYTASMGDEQAAQQAAADMIAAKRSQLFQKRQNDINGALAQERIVGEVEAIKKQTGKDVASAWVDIQEKAYGRKQGVLRQAYANLNEFVNEFRSKAFGLTSDRARIKNVVREMLGDTTKDTVAAQHGKALKETFDLLHRRYKNAGGIIGTLDNYFPQVHIKERLQQVDFDEWYNTIRPRLDTNRMVDFDTGLPFEDARLRELMLEDYNDIITGGRSSLQKRVAEGKQTFGVGGDISQRRQASRFYHFKDSKAFLEYNEAFGLGDDGLYDAITGVIETMSRDIGIMEVLGAKPNSINRHMQLRMEAEGVGQIRQGWARGAYDVLTGRTDGDVTNDSLGGRSIRFMHSTQNVLRSALLGSASISALSDSTFVVAASRMQGLSGTRAISKYAKQLNPASSTDRNLARRSGYISEIATQGALSDMRISGGDQLGNKLTASMASFTNRASGLAAMTRAARDSVALEFQATLSDLQKTPWGKLPADFKRAAEANLVDETDWAVIQKTELMQPEEGVSFLRQNEIALAGDDAAKALDTSNKIDDWITKTQNLAVNEPTLRTRSITTGAAFSDDVRKGTLGRTIASTFFMFKSFPVTVMFNHVLPMFKTAKKGSYEHLATVALGTTLIGGLAVQLKEISKGKDPRNMEDPKFWVAANMQGGGLGLFGDFLFSDYSRFGRDPLVDFFTGATGGLASDVLRTFKGNFDRALEGEDQDKFLRDVFNLAKRNTPAVNLWYSRLALERLFLDQIEDAIDPKFNKRRRAMERRHYQEFGTKYWWRKGETAPSRAPEVGKKVK